MNNTGGNHYDTKTCNSIGVLTADTPVGPWTDPIGKELIGRDVPGCSLDEIGWLFDPAVLVDDDGTGYLYFGGIGDTTGKEEAFIRNPKCARVVKLGDDMVSLASDAKTIDAPFMFEDSGINKIGDKYYYSYCTNWTSMDDRTVNGIPCPTANIAVMVSDSPMGEFKYVGCVMKNPGVYFGAYGNNHHCFTSYQGKYYAFYHTKSDSTRLGLPADYRTTYVDLLNLGANGNFTEADGSAADTKMTADGVTSLQTVDPFAQTEAETFSMADGVGTAAGPAASTNILWATGNRVLANGKVGGYVGVSNVDFGTEGATAIDLEMSETGSDTYGTYEASLKEKVTGTHTIYFVFEKAGILVDNWTFKK